MVSHYFILYSTALIALSSAGKNKKKKTPAEPVIPVDIPVCTICDCLNGTDTGVIYDANLTGEEAQGPHIPGSIIQCQMKLLSYQTLEHMVFPDRIESLDFRFQGLSNRLSPDMFVRLWGKKVKELHIGRNRIRRITEGMFKGAESVTFLDISDGGVRSIPNRAFRTLEFLQALWLDMNGIGFLDQGMFCGLDRLRELNLNGNRIRYIMPGVFQNLPNLKHLYLDQNRIRHLPGNLFYGLQKLEHLSVANNYIRTIDQGVFNGLKNSITFLDLANTDPRGLVIPFDMQTSYQLECADWELEFGCQTLTNLTDNSGYFMFNETSIVVPQDNCLAVDEIFSYENGSCENSTDLALCCNGLSHLREIFGMTVDYWNNECCGSMAYWGGIYKCADLSFI